jgi:hypothetical protein
MVKRYMIANHCPRTQYLCNSKAPLTPGCGVAYQADGEPWRVGIVTTVRPLMVSGVRAKRKSVWRVESIHQDATHVVDGMVRSVPYEQHEVEIDAATAAIGWS